MKFPEAIEVNPSIMMGKPCLRGTRIPVYLILQKLAAGETQQDILAAYPQLKSEHLQACFAYAANLASDEVYIASA